MKELENLWSEYRIYKGVKIYPFIMKDYHLFEDLTPILLFNKNALGQVEIIKMSYLRFLLTVAPYAVDENGKQVCKNVLDKLHDLLRYVFKEQDFRITIGDDGKFSICVFIENDSVSLSERDFDNIKKIILEQNAIYVYDDLHPDLKRELQENMKFLNQKQGYRDGTIEDLVVSYKCELKLNSYEPIKKMTVYQFRKELARLNLIKDYQIYKTGECSGMVEFKKPIPHWLSHIDEKPDYSNLLVNRKEIETKIDSFQSGLRN